MKILALSGFVPEQICDTVRFTQYAGERNISHYCGYASDFISQVLQDDGIDGAVYPKSCDSARILTSYLEGSAKFLFQFGVPSFGSAGALEYLASEILSYKEAVERHYGISIHDIEKRIALINARNSAIRHSYETLETVSYAEYLRRIHEMLKRPLAEQNWSGELPSGQSTEKCVFLVGSFLSNLDIAKQIEDAGLAVAGDTLPESGRLVSAKQADASGDIYLGIAESILSARLSPTQNDFREILDKDFAEMKRKDVRGILFVTQKYCEPYDYLYAAYKVRADERKLPIAQISVSGTGDYGKAALTLEAFADTL